MDYMKGLYQTRMTDEVLSWDDSSNNQAFLGGELLLGAQRREHLLRGQGEGARYF